MTLFVRVTGLDHGKPGFSGPQGTKTPELIDIKHDMGNQPPHAKFGALTRTGGGATHA